MRGKKPKQPASLWEVMNSDRLKQSQQKVKKQIVPADEVVKEEKPTRQYTPENRVKSEKLRYKPKFRVTKPMVLGGFVVIVVVIGLIFALGRDDDVPQFDDVAIDEVVENDQVTVFPPLDDVENDEAIGNQPGKTVSDAGKDHVIVIASYNVAKDLEPVKEYFARNGVKTEIMKQDGSIFYLLVTQKRYESPLRRDTDGFYALEKIKNIGAEYDAPKGYEPFGKKPFQDAYGMKIKN